MTSRWGAGEEQRKGMWGAGEEQRKSRGEQRKNIGRADR